MIEVGRDIWRLPSPTLRLTARSSRAGCSGPCPDGFWVSPWMASTSPLGNLFYLITLTVTSFLCLQGISCISICALCLLSFHWARLRRVWIHVLYSHQVFIHMHKIPLSLLFTRLNSPRTLSHSLYNRCSKSLTIFVAHCRTHCSKCLSCTGELDTAPQMCLTRAEQTRRVTVLNQVATHPWLLLAAFAARAHC